VVLVAVLVLGGIVLTLIALIAWIAVTMHHPEQDT
jgi:hypothetical protein